VSTVVVLQGLREGASVFVLNTPKHASRVNYTSFQFLASLRHCCDDARRLDTSSIDIKRTPLLVYLGCARLVRIP
jgi:hypothetical protein